MYKQELITLLTYLINALPDNPQAIIDINSNNAIPGMADVKIEINYDKEDNTND